MRTKTQAWRVLAAAGLTVGWLATLGWAQDARVTNSHIHLDLTGTVVVPTGTGANCAQPDTVTIQPGSDVNVVAAIKKRGSFVHANLADVTGLGETAPTQTYIGVGARKFPNIQLPPPGQTLTLQANFRLVHTADGCASSPLPVTLKLVFTSSGRLIADQSSATAGP